MAGLKSLVHLGLQPIGPGKQRIEPKHLAHGPTIWLLWQRRAHVRWNADGKLEEIVCRGNSGITAEDLMKLEGIEQVKIMSLDGAAMDDRMMAAIGRFKKMERLSLEGAKITDAAAAKFAALVELTDIDLDNTTIGDATLETLKRLPKLRKIELNGTRATAAGIADFRRARPQVRIDNSQP